MYAKHKHLLDDVHILQVSEFGCTTFSAGTLPHLEAEPSRWQDRCEEVRSGRSGRDGHSWHSVEGRQMREIIQDYTIIP